MSFTLPKSSVYLALGSNLAERTEDFYTFTPLHSLKNDPSIYG
jgi:7,8-dihydro-6-hydroxymethylpterin-pyrophosphokinase